MFSGFFSLIKKGFLLLLLFCRLRSHLVEEDQVVNLFLHLSLGPFLLGWWWWFEREGERKRRRRGGRRRKKEEEEEEEEVSQRKEEEKKRASLRLFSRAAAAAAAPIERGEIFIAGSCADLPPNSLFEALWRSCVISSRHAARWLPLKRNRGRR